MMKRCLRLQGKHLKRHKCRDLANLWVTSLRLPWLEVAMLFVELRSFNQILLEISSHGSTKKCQRYTEGDIDPM